MDLVSIIGRVSWIWSELSVVCHGRDQHYRSFSMDLISINPSFAMDLISIIGRVPWTSLALSVVCHGLDQHYRLCVMNFISIVRHLPWT